MTESVDQFIFTNLAIYKAIADETYEEMVRLVEKGRRPRSNGSGWIVSYDPSHTSFKKAMISIVFTGMWFEALMHLLIVKEFGAEKFKEYNFKSYEEKLKLLGFSDQALIERIRKYRTARKELVHEKAHFDDGTMKTAQSEAENAHKIMHELQTQLTKRLN